MPLSKKDHFYEKLQTLKAQALECEKLTENIKHINNQFIKGELNTIMLSLKELKSSIYQERRLNQRRLAFALAHGFGGGGNSELIQKIANLDKDWKVRKQKVSEEKIDRLLGGEFGWGI